MSVVRENLDILNPAGSTTATGRRGAINSASSLTLSYPEEFKIRMVLLKTHQILRQ